MCGNSFKRYIIAAFGGCFVFACRFEQPGAERRDVVEDLCSSFLVAVRCEYSQRVAADVHHQLQRRVSVFGCFTSRTALFVHFCLHHTKK